MNTIYNGEMVQQDNGLRGCLFLPSGEQLCGAIVILHERYGLVQHTIDLAKKLYEAGHVAFAPDMFFGHYKNQEAVNKGEESVLITDSQCADALDRSIEYLKKHNRVNAEQIVIMGVCQSGRYPIVVNSRRKDIAANVIFYGAAGGKEWETTDTNEEPMEEMVRRLDAPSFFVFAEKDHVISFDLMIRMRNCLESANKSYRMKIYATAPHGFLNDTMPGRYRHDLAQEAWNQLLTFVDQVFNGQWSKNAIRWEFQSCISTDYDYSQNIRLE
jgi:carboxymethylenebutenolidase